MALTVPIGARTIAFDDNPPTLRGRLYNPPAPSLPAKDPTENLTYGLDFGRVIEGAHLIIQTDVDILPAGAVQLVEASWLGTTVIVRAAGGVDQTTAEIAVKVVLSNGSFLRRSANLPIAIQTKLAPLPVPGSVLTLNDAILQIGDFVIPDGS